MFDVKETVPVFVLMSVFAEVLIFNPTSSISEYAMLIPSSSINLSFTRNFTLSSIVRSDVIKFGSKMFT